NTHMMEECYHSEALESSAKESNQVPTETLGSVEFSQRLPQVNLLAGEGPLVDTQLGSCMQARPSEQQGTGRDGDKVTEVQPGSSLTVTTASGVYGPESLVITAGHWANTLVSNIGLQLPQQLEIPVNYSLLNLSASGTYGISHFPCFVQMGEEGAVYHFYGLLSNECPGLMKVRNTMEHKEWVRQTDRTDILFLSQFVSLYLSGLEPEPALVESCLYTVTPDHHFVLDCHPHHGNIVIGAGFLCMFTGVPIQLSWSWYCVLASLYNIYLHIPALKNHIKTYSQMATC
uniref:Uncharacterized protein n=1 Tax=Oncorhynchus tshawytscha TaxID=74940 RepID=A0AAZ3SW06_ONCTS